MFIVDVYLPQGEADVAQSRFHGPESKRVSPQEGGGVRMGVRKLDVKKNGSETKFRVVSALGLRSCGNGGKYQK